MQAEPGTGPDMRPYMVARMVPIPVRRRKTRIPESRGACCQKTAQELSCDGIQTQRAEQPEYNTRSEALSQRCLSLPAARGIANEGEREKKEARVFATMQHVKQQK